VHTLSVGTPQGSDSVVEKREKMGKFNLHAGSTTAQNGVTQRSRLFYLVMALVLGGMLLASRLVEPSRLPNVCLPDMLFGIPCITTGLTRAFHAISLGQLHIALAHHPLSLLLYGLMVFHILLALFRFLGWKARLIRLPNRVQAMIWGTIGLLVLSWIPRVVGLVTLK